MYQAVIQLNHSPLLRSRLLRIRSITLAQSPNQKPDRIMALGLPFSFSTFGASITPFASRTYQSTKEQLGQAEDKVRRDATPLGDKFKKKTQPLISYLAL